MNPAHDKFLALNVECYPNYFAVGIRWFRMDGRVTTPFIYEILGSGLRPEASPTDDLEILPFDVKDFRILLENDALVGYNIDGYDLPMIKRAIAEPAAASLHVFSRAIIGGQLKRRDVERHVANIQVKTSIDLLMIAPAGFVPLKLYEARMGMSIEDLPLDPT